MRGWNSSRPSSPAAANYPTVYVPGESRMPPGLSHDLCYELFYDRHLDPEAVGRTYPGLLKADDQLHHLPKSSKLNHSAHRFSQRRHFPQKDHIIHDLSGLSSI
jgi:hypothetical protein